MLSANNFLESNQSEKLLRFIRDDNDKVINRICVIQGIQGIKRIQELYLFQGFQEIQVIQGIHGIRIIYELYLFQKLYIFQNI